MMSHEHHGVWNHRQLIECSTIVQVNNPRWSVDSPDKGTVMCKVSPQHDIIMNDLHPHWCFCLINSSPPGQNGHHFADNIFKCIFMDEKFYILTWISLKFVPKGPIDNDAALVQVIAWHQTSDKPLPEPMLTQLTIYATLGGDKLTSWNNLVSINPLCIIHVAILTYKYDILYSQVITVVTDGWSAHVISVHLFNSAKTAETVTGTEFNNYCT